ncbi:ACP S-malonyltransferase [Helicobacter bizzozeronii]|uniref:ACP S-malonyltransferase n=1 Tax=Helicobacter bizzozeronii TaxID=56877 RepID=UPI000CF07032
MMAVWLFGGQGSQHVGMGQDFCTHSSLAKEMCEEASDVLKTDMEKLLWTDNPDLNKSAYTQSAIFLVSMMAFRLFMSQAGDLVPKMGLGHSLGEISANGASGALSLEQGLRLVFERGRLMEEVCTRHAKELGMLAVLGAPTEGILAYCDRVRAQGQLLHVANFNGSQVVLAGEKEFLQALEPKSLGAKKLVLLPMSVVSHCPILAPMVADFKALLQESLQDSYAFGIVSNATTQIYQNKADALECLGVQLVKPVLYDRCLQVCETQADYYIEFGTSVLKNLNKRLSNKPTFSVTDMASLEEALKFVQDH